MFKSITVNSGVQLTVASGTVLRVAGAVNIQGTIKVMTCAQDNAEIADKGVSRVAASTYPGARAQGLTVAQARMVKIPLCGGGAGRIGWMDPTTSGGAGGGSFAIYASGAIAIPTGGKIDASGAAGIAGNSPYGSVGVGGGAGGKYQIHERVSYFYQLQQ